MSPDPTQVIALQNAIAAQVGAAVMLTFSFMEIALVSIAVAMGWRKTAMGLFALYGFTTFWVPSVVTMYISPSIFLISIAGLVYAFFFADRPQRPVVPVE